MRVRSLKQHRSTHGLHARGDEYEESKANAEAKIAQGIVAAVEVTDEEAKKASAPENKKARTPSVKSEPD